MQIRANTKAVDHWFLMLFIVLIFLYFIGYVLALGTVTTKSWFQRLVVFLFMHVGKQQMAKIFCHISNLFYLYTVGL